MEQSKTTLRQQLFWIEKNREDDWWLCYSDRGSVISQGPFKSKEEVRKAGLRLGYTELD